jgi:hypothetical protein
MTKAIAKSFLSAGLGAVLLVALGRPDASAQVRPWVGLGSRVAVPVAPTPDAGYGNEWWVGTLERITADSLYLRLEKAEQTRAMLRGSVSRLRVSSGTEGHAETGLLLGALAGIPVGYGVATTQKKPTGWGEVISGEQAAGFALSWVACTAVGGVLGAIIRTDRWHDVDVATLPPLPASSRGGRATD